jgi:outer membrane protein assembly factor BamB
VAGCGVVLLGLKSAVTLRRELPHPKPEALAVSADARRASVARWSVAAVAVLIAGTAGILAMWIGGGPAQAPTAEATWPSPEEIRRNWPYFRGPGGLAISAYTNVPASWNGKTGDGVLWKTKVPLAGENSPIVWGNRVFVTGADAKKREVYCFDADSGKLLWTGEVSGIPGSPAMPPKVPQETGFACPTAVTDGQRVYAIFANGDVAAFDFEGRRAWARNLGVPKSTYGYSSSLTMHRNRVLVLMDQTPVEEGRSKLLALDSATGRTAWEIRRPVRDSWASPNVATVAGREQVLTIADPYVIGYDPDAGRELWRAKVLGGDVAPSPVSSGSLVFAVQPYAKLVAVRADGQGDVTSSAVAWKADQNLPDICSPLATGDLVFLLTSPGVLTCFDAKDGKKLWNHDFEQECRASPSLVGDRVYLVTEEGTTILVAAARQFKELGRAELGEKVHASPALLDGRIYMRGMKHLFAIGSK